MKRYCRTCNEELDYEYYRCYDNFLMAKYFEEIDGSDNVFCSKDCFCDALFLESRLVEDDEEFTEYEEE